MLQQFTWTQFLITAIVLTSVWYLLIYLLIFRKRTETLQTEIKRENVQRTNESAEVVAPLMGKAKLPEGLEQVACSQLQFAPAQGSEDEKMDQLGLIPDVLQELKEIFEMLAREDGTKKDFLLLTEMIAEKYGRIGGHPRISHINAFIKENAPFSISDEELENIW